MYRCVCGGRAAAVLWVSSQLTHAFRFPIYFTMAKNEVPSPLVLLTSCRRKISEHCKLFTHCEKRIKTKSIQVHKKEKKKQNLLYNYIFIFYIDLNWVKNWSSYTKIFMHLYDFFHCIKYLTIKNSAWTIDPSKWVTNVSFKFMTVTLGPI